MQKSTGRVDNHHQFQQPHSRNIKKSIDILRVQLNSKNMSAAQKGTLHTPETLTTMLEVHLRGLLPTKDNVMLSFIQSNDQRSNIKRLPTWKLNHIASSFIQTPSKSQIRTIFLSPQGLKVSDSGIEPDPGPFPSMHLGTYPSQWLGPYHILSLQQLLSVRWTAPAVHHENH